MKVEYAARLAVGPAYVAEPPTWRAGECRPSAVVRAAGMPAYIEAHAEVKVGCRESAWRAARVGAEDAALAGVSGRGGGGG